MKAFITFLGLSLALIMAGCGNNENRTPVTAAAPAKRAVELITLKAGKVSTKLNLTAEIIPNDRANIYARTAGYVKDVKVDIGSYVKKGQVLCILDAPELQAGEAQSRSKSQGVYSTFQSSRNTYFRMLKASKTPGAIAGNELDIARNQMKTDSSAYQASRAANQANYALEDYLTIRAPFNGVVTARNIFKGDYVDNTGKILLLTVEDNSSLRVQVPVPEAYNATKIENNEASFTVSAFPDRIFKGRLARKSDAISSDTRSETWEFNFPNLKGALKPGMFAQVILMVDRPNPGFMVPYKTVVTTQERKFVVKLDNGKAKWVDVKTGFSGKDNVEIAGDLKEGDQLVKQANEEIKEGSTIKVKQ
jgi:membrane fusion protein (multidrug efflux system)